MPANPTNNSGFGKGSLPARRLRLVALAALLAGTTAVASAATFIPVSDPELYSRADVVVHGVVVLSGHEGDLDGVRAGSTSGLLPLAERHAGRMAKFLLLGEHGSSFNPPAATGTAFGDVYTDTLLAKWIEQLKAEAITSGCGSGNDCPTGTVNRGEMAKFIRLTFGL